MAEHISPAPKAPCKYSAIPMSSSELKSHPAKRSYRVTKQQRNQPTRRSSRLQAQLEEHTGTDTVFGRHDQLPSPDSEIQSRQAPKRKRGEVEDDVLSQPVKRSARPAYTKITPATSESSEDESGDPLTYWAKHNTWPPNFAEKPLNMSERSAKKRSRSTSYTKSVRDGESPRAYSLEYEKKMNDHGMITDNFQELATIADESKQLCDELLRCHYEPPSDTLFHDEYFKAALRGAYARNETRVARDIMPMIVPSAELLHIRKVADLKAVVEELNTDWSKCGVIYGPQPKPDFAAGLAASSFTPDELLKLKSKHTDLCPTYMTADLYLPFLICEIKSANNPLAEAERQTMHSASIAVRAIIELYRSVSREKELDQKIVVFSVAHDPRFVSLYGHYACVTGEKVRFFRHLIRSFDFTADSTNRWTAYNFTRKVYDLFVPQHLERIRSVLSQLSEQPPESEYEISVDGDVEAPSQALVPSTASSQNGGEFKKPSMSATAIALEQVRELQKTNRELQEQVATMARQQQDIRQEDQRLQQEEREMMKRQLDQQEQMIALLQQGGR